MRSLPSVCNGPLEARLAARIGAVLLLVGSSPLVMANCHTLLDQRGVIVFQSTTSPINLAQRISTELDARFPRHHLVMSDANNCPEVDELSRRAGGVAGTPVDLNGAGPIRAARGGPGSSISWRVGYTAPAGEPGLASRSGASGRAPRPDRR